MATDNAGQTETPNKKKAVKDGKEEGNPVPKAKAAAKSKTVAEESIRALEKLQTR